MQSHKKVLTPADLEFWTEFYEEGQGKKESYEWYIAPDQMLKAILSHVDSVAATPDISSKNKFNGKLATKERVCQILEVGCGTSELGLRVATESRSRVEILCTDPCEVAIEKSRARHSSLPQNNAVSRVRYEIMDARALPLEDASIDVVMEKGLLDALLSHGGDEYGQCTELTEILHEIHRVLRPGGVYVFLSGNDEFVLQPYLLDESLIWASPPAPQQLQFARNPRATTFSTYYLYTLIKSTPETEAEET